MNLYIETEDGVTKNHPAYEDNLIQAFGAVPAHWEPFIRVAAPPVGTFEVYEGASYALVDGVWTDVHNVRPMSDEEKAAKIEQARASLPPNWTLDTETLRPVRPLMPTTGGPWKFDMVTAKDWVIATEPPRPSWVLREDGLCYVPPVPKPQDGNQYRWDEPTISWIQLNV
jgi:hypothetical protein